MNTSSSPVIAADEQQRRQRIARSAYARGRRAAEAALTRRSLGERAALPRPGRGTVVVERPRTPDGTLSALTTDAAVARAAAYTAAAALAVTAARAESGIADSNELRDIVAQAGIHEQAWRDRLGDAGIDPDALDAGDPDELRDARLQEFVLDETEFESIAENTLDASADTAGPPGLDPAELAQIPEAMQLDRAEPVDITGWAEVVDIDLAAEVSTESEVQPW